MVGASASTVKVAEGWEIGSESGGDGETGSSIIKETCLLDPGVQVVSIEEDSVGRAGPVEFKWGNFSLNLAPDARLGAFGFFASLPRVSPASAPLLFRFCWYRAIASGFPQNVGKAIFALFVGDDSSAGSLVCSSFVLFFIGRIRLFTARFAFANGDESVGDESDSG